MTMDDEDDLVAADKSQRGLFKSPNHLVGRRLDMATTEELADRDDGRPRGGPGFPHGWDHGKARKWLYRERGELRAQEDQ